MRAGACCAVLQVVVAATLAGCLGPVSAASAVRNTLCPQNYIIGAEGCGTHSMFHHLLAALQLQGHEPSFYSRRTFDRLNAPSNIQRTAPEFEFAPAYLHNPQAALRIKTFCNYTDEAPPRFVAFVCDPAAHVWSTYKAGAQASKERSGAASSSIQSGAALVESYRACVKTTLQTLKECLARHSYKECGDLLHGPVVPGTGPDAMGMQKPCSGIIYKSLFEEQLALWFRTFPKSSHYVFHMEDAVEFPDILVASIAGFFDIPHKVNGVIDRNVVENHHNMFESVEPPKETQATLKAFLGSQWEKHVTRIPFSLRAAAQARAKRDAAVAKRQAAVAAKAAADM